MAGMDGRGGMPGHLDPSELGTKEFWEETYSADLLAHEHGGNDQDDGDDDDEGGGGAAASSPPELEGWFADVGASGKIVEYLISLTTASDTAQSEPPLLDRKQTTFLDLGTGNGELLFLLREEGGFEGEMLGVDYAARGVELCRRFASERRRKRRGDAGRSGVGDEQEMGESERLRFEVWDIMRDDPAAGSCIWPKGRGAVGGADGEVGGWDVVLDKGTFDAVSLSGEKDGEGRRVCEGYAGRVKGLVRKGGGLLLVTSCNWTEGELRRWFEGEVDGGGQAEGQREGELYAVGRIEYPVFRFGGAVGQSVCSVLFRRR